MSYLVLARKWRPRGFDDLVGQEPIMRILKSAVSQGRTAHAYLFSGPRGVGKTSTARILAKAMNCKEGPTPAPCGVCDSCTAITEGSSVDVIEIDGASNNSVDDVRDLRERVKYAPSGGKYKVYIIDEVHMLSGSAFNALLKTLEEPPAHVIFILATTEMKKIPATVISRCQHMPFRRISNSVIRDRLRTICEAEGISISSPALGMVVRAAEGSMRDSLTILDQLASFSMNITEEDVKSLLGIADLGLMSRIARAVIGGDRPAIVETVELLTEQGTDMRSFTRELVQFFRDLLVASVVSSSGGSARGSRNPGDVLDLSSEEISVVSDILPSSSEEQLTLMLSEMMKVEAAVRGSALPRLALEMGLIRASFLSTLKPLRDVIENINKYSGQLPGRATVGPVAKKEEKERDGSPNTAQEMETKENRGESAEAPAVPAQDTPDEDLAVAGRTTEAGNEPVDLQTVWARTLAKLDPPLASKLTQAKVEFSGDELMLTLSDSLALFEDSIKAGLDVIVRTASAEVGRSLRIKVSVAQKKTVRKKDLKEKVMNEPFIKEALELFEGRIVNITPIADSEN
jgi:DNA polymerase-3 subunit gamma/tau